MKEAIQISLFILVIAGIAFGALIYTTDHTQKEYRYRSCTESMHRYDKVDIDTAKINCKKVWKK